MTVSNDMLLEVLPPFNNNSILIEQKQEVHDIIKEVVNAHKHFAPDYDYIFQFFDKGSTKEICKNLFQFCKQNIDYKIENEERQTTKSPAAIVATGNGDCKHYAGFIAGVLSAITRNTSHKIFWVYRFASYSFFEDEVQHVFVVAFDKGNEIWIDPVLCCFDTRSPSPVSIIDKKINMLTRVSGIELQRQLQLHPINFESDYLQDNAMVHVVNLPVPIDEDDYYTDDIPPAVVENIKMLLYYGIIDESLNIHTDVYLDVVSALPLEDANALSNAYGSFLNQVQGPAAIGDIFGDIWGAVKQVSLAIPRGAYLSLVSLNVFNLAGHLNKCIINADGSKDQAGIDKLQGIWHKKLAGDTNILLRAIRNGATKKAILGIHTDTPIIGVAPAAAAWAATAAVIIAAMTPIITQILKGKNSFDAMTQQQLGMQPLPPGATNKTLSSYLPYIIIGGVGLYVYLNNKKRK